MDYKTQLEENGFAVLKGFTGQLNTSLNSSLPEKNTRFCLEKIPSLIPFANSIKDFLAPRFPTLFFNRSIFFTKSTKNNWSVLWHQDLTLAVRERFNKHGYGPWSVKEKIDHVQPPVEILENMVAIRLHIDDCTRENGTLKIMPGSHKSGILDRDKILEVTENSKAEYCQAQAGDLLLMKPLLLHSSESASDNCLPRRVLHLEFVTEQLPDFVKLYHS